MTDKDYEVLELPEDTTFESTFGNRYTDLWTFPTRVVPSFEILNDSATAVCKGRVDLIMPDRKDGVIASQYLLVVDAEGSRQILVFDSFTSLGSYINNSKPLKILKDGKKWYFEFDTNKSDEESPRDNLGVYRIGLLYAPDFGDWIQVPNSPEESVVHITLDKTKHGKNIEVVVRTDKSNRIAVNTIRRDLPLVKLNNYYQYGFIQDGLISYHSVGDDELIVTKVSGPEKIKEVWYRYL